MGSTSLTAAVAVNLSDHWAWRPEWTPERTCLYWYLTPDSEQLAAALDEQLPAAVRRTDWLDVVPAQWWHVTVADVGFEDELGPADVDAVVARVAAEVGHTGPLPLTLGPVETLRSAVVLAVGPLERLRQVKAGVRRATSAVLGERYADVHRHLFWPHLSLGYAARSVDAHTVSTFLDALPEAAAHVDVDALTLVAVTRRDHRYQWEVRARVELG